MDQLVYNCLLYNPVGTYVRSLGQKIEQRWLDNWRRNPILQGGWMLQAAAYPDPAAGLLAGRQAAWRWRDDCGAYP